MYTRDQRSTGSKTHTTDILLETVLHILVVGVSAVANKVPVVATNITVMTDFDCYV